MSDDKSKSKLHKRFFRKIGITPGCWTWKASKNKDGYGWFWLDGRMGRAHRASYEIHYGPIPDGMHVLHKCDNPSCTNPDHLFLGTHDDNMKDMARKSRAVPSVLRGSEHGGSKLSDQDVLAIRAAKGVRQKDLASQFGITFQQVSNIRLRKCWAHLHV